MTANMRRWAAIAILLGGIWLFLIVRNNLEESYFLNLFGPQGSRDAGFQLLGYAVFFGVILVGFPWLFARRLWLSARRLDYFSYPPKAQAMPSPLNPLSWSPRHLVAMIVSAAIAGVALFLLSAVLTRNGDDLAYWIEDDGAIWFGAGAFLTAAGFYLWRLMRRSNE